MTGGVFTPAARAAILNATLGRCAGCGGTWQINAHHRRPRGAGGTSDPTVGEPHNGLALCGDGVQGCHGWAEHNRDTASHMGWLLRRPEPTIPAWTKQWGWCTWTLLTDGDAACWCIVPFGPSPGPHSERAVLTFNDYLKKRDHARRR